MSERSPAAALFDIVEAIGHIRTLVNERTLAEFEADWRTRWLAERGFEIVSEASRRLPPTLKERHPTLPWSKIAALGNFLRHEYDRIAGDVLWKLAKHDLDELDAVCRSELNSLSNNAAPEA